MHKGLIVNLKIKIKSGEYLESDNTQNAWQVNLQLGAYGPFSIICNILYYEMCRVSDSFTKANLTIMLRRRLTTRTVFQM